MTASAEQPSRGIAASFAQPIARVAILLACACLLLLAAAPLGWRLGVWHLSTAFVLMRWAAYGAIAGAAAALLALCGWRRLTVALRWGAIAALAVSGLVFYMPWHYTLVAGASIHDISTDTDDPPPFEAVLPARTAAHAATADYAGPALAATQKRAYPDIAPLYLDLPRDAAFGRALKAAEAMPRWTIVASDPERGRIEASARTFWMGFTDDVVIRVTGSGSRSRVDMRSLSRIGRGDFGANAARIRAYFAALRAGAG